jgi:transposase
MKAYSLDFRQKLVDTYQNELISQRQLAKRFGVALSVVTRLLKQYYETGQLAPKQRPGRPKALKAEQVQVVQELVTTQPDLTLGELCQALQAREGVRVSKSTLCRVMKQLELTRKKKSLHPTDKESERVQVLRHDYWDEVRDVAVKNLIFLDESGVNLGLIRLFAWALRGQRAYGKQPKRSKSVSIVAALSLKGVVASANILGAFNGLTFEAFIATRLVPKLWKGACVVMDNCSIHKDKDGEIRRLIEEAGAKLVYLPPYSPDFSPIENFWSKVKMILQSIGARSYQALSEAIETAFAQVCKKDIKNWFSHCCYCSS